MAIRKAVRLTLWDGQCETVCETDESKLMRFELNGVVVYELQIRNQAGREECDKYLPPNVLMTSPYEVAETEDRLIIIRYVEVSGAIEAA